MKMTEDDSSTTLFMKSQFTVFYYTINRVIGKLPSTLLRQRKATNGLIRTWSERVGHST